MSALGQGFPLPNSPMVDLATGFPNQVWFDFFLNAWRRTGGGAGPTLSLGNIADSVTDAQIAAALADLPVDLSQSANTTALQAQQTDVQTLLALSDVPDRAPDADQAVLLALLLTDGPDAASGSLGFGLAP